MTRTRFVQMQAVLDAMDTRAGDARFFLDLERGEVELSLSPEDGVSGDEAGLLATVGGLVEIPRRALAAAEASMRTFAASVQDELLRRRLEAALEEDGTGRAFRVALAADPVVAIRFARREREGLLDEALAWLGGLGISPMYELPALSAPVPGAPGAARVGLWEILLLGAPLSPGGEGAPRAGRRFVARDPEEARRAFERTARDLAVRAGVAFASSSLEKGRGTFALDGAQVTLRGRVVEVEVELPGIVWELFAETTG